LLWQTPSVGNSRIIQKSFIASLLLFALLVQPSSAIGFSAKYKNCAQLKAKHRFGVALSLKIAGNYPATISKQIYVENGFLDSDSDGIVCENELLQNNLNPKTKWTTPSTPSTPSTTLKAATTVVPIAPLPTSPQFLRLQSGGTATLRRGITYQIYACVNKQGLPFKLEIYLIRTGWSYKAFSTETVDAVRCSTPGYPFQITWVWQVSENIGEVSKMRVIGFLNGPIEMTVVITN
jgi:hypothetical protein